MLPDIIEINGSYQEGGGQIIRTALTLSSLMQKPVRITNIRANRPNPGLAAQHLTAATSVRKVCRGALDGAELGSSALTFTPGGIVGGKYELDIGTAGSVTLVAQTLLPILLHAEKESEITIKGGTHVIKSPGYDYFENVFLPAIGRMGANVEGRLIRPGYYPKGGGAMQLSIKPSKLRGVVEWPAEEGTKAIIRIANLPLSIAMREKKVLVQNGIADIIIPDEEALCPGNAVTLYSGFRGSYVPGEKTKRAEAVAQEAVDGLGAEKCAVDRHLADQLLVYAVLADSITSFETSEFTTHFTTNSYVLSRFTDRKIEIKGNRATIM